MSFGYHASLGSTLLSTVSDHLRRDVTGIQIYIGGNQTYTRRVFSDGDLAATRALLTDSGFRLYTHSCLCMNLAAPAPAQTRNVACLRDELRAVEGCGATTVVHIGSQTVGKTLEGTLGNVLATLAQLPLQPRAEGQRYPLLLENAAGEGRKFGSTLADLSYLFARCGEGVGLCLDTAHAFGAGLFDFSSVEAIDEMFAMVDEAVGKDRLALVHLNDSKVPFGARVDHHENLGYGHIWKDDLEPCRYLIRECRRRGVDVVLETPAEHGAEDYALGCRARE